MNKEEILNKARSENQNGNKDEREKVIYDKSFYFSYLLMGIMGIVFIIAKVINQQDASDSEAMLFSAAVGGFGYRFAKNRNVKNLVFALIMLGMAVLRTLTFFGAL